MNDVVRTITDHNKSATFIDHPDHLEARFASGDSALVTSAARLISEKVGKPVKAVREYGNKRLEFFWYTNGVQYNPFGGPAQSSFGLEVWTGPDGNYHRVGGPSRIEKTGQAERMEWKQNNALHRTDGPAMSLINFNTDWPRHCKFGDLPANFKVHEDHRALFGATERVSLYASREHGYYQHGKLHGINDRAALGSEHEVIESISVLEDGSIMKKTYCDVKSWRWYSHGVEHRTTGPARVVMSNCYEEWKNDTLITRRCAGWDVEWYLDGFLLNNHDVVQWLTRHHVLLIEPYRIEGSVWREQQDEFAFVQDFMAKMNQAA